jgi:cathepsin D
MCVVHNRYDSSDSPNYKDLKQNMAIAYGSGILEGKMSEDTFYLDNIRIANQSFTEIIRPYDGFFNDAYFDGIVGLGLPGLAQKDSTPIMDNIIDQKLLNSNVFSFYFDRTQNYTRSYISFGTIEDNYYEGSLNYHNVIDDKYWQITLDAILIDDIDTKLCEGDCKAILDTGTTLINGSAKDLWMLIDLLQIKKDCGNYLYLPTIGFVIGGVKYELKPEDYVLAKRDKIVGDSEKEEFKMVECVGGFSAMNLPAPVGPSWVFGSIFLSKLFSVFDRDRMRVGFGKPKHGETIEQKVATAKRLRRAKDKLMAKGKIIDQLEHARKSKERKKVAAPERRTVDPPKDPKPSRRKKNSKAEVSKLDEGEFKKKVANKLLKTVMEGPARVSGGEKLKMIKRITKLFIKKKLKGDDETDAKATQKILVDKPLRPEVEIVARANPVGDSKPEPVNPTLESGSAQKMLAESPFR